MLTDKQTAILRALAHYHGHDSPTARKLADGLETPTFRSARYSYDEVYSQLRRLEKEHLVEGLRGSRAVRWRITDAGLKELPHFTHPHS